MATIRRLLLLIPCSALACAYPELTMGTGSGGTVSAGNGGTTTKPAGKGGSLASGGVRGTGGARGTGGQVTVSGTGGSAPTVTSSVVFKNGKADGIMKGYGFVGLGALDTLTSPTCGATKAAITSSAPCPVSYNWSKTDALCTTGNMPKLPDAPSAADYDANWGIQVSANVTDPAGGGLGESFTSVSFTFSGDPGAVLRAVLHRKNDGPKTGYCYEPLTSGKVIPFTSFSSACWDAAQPGQALTASDVLNLDQIGITLNPSTKAAIPIADFCMSRINLIK